MAVEFSNENHVLAVQCAQTRLIPLLRRKGDSVL
jgi:hypothetical protein